MHGDAYSRVRKPDWRIVAPLDTTVPPAVPSFHPRVSHFPSFVQIVSFLESFLRLMIRAPLNMESMHIFSLRTSLAVLGGALQ